MDGGRTVQHQREEGVWQCAEGGLSVACEWAAGVAVQNGREVRLGDTRTASGGGGTEGGHQVAGDGFHQVAGSCVCVGGGRFSTARESCVG